MMNPSSHSGLYNVKEKCVKERREEQETEERGMENNEKGGGGGGEVEAR